jgi:hypothetical protein
MSLNHPGPGIGAVGEYQSSGLPFVTGSTTNTVGKFITFPKVTRAITVRNTDGTGGNIFVGFTENGVRSATASNRFQIPVSASERFEVRVKEVYIGGSGAATSFSLFAELTLIDAKEMPVLTGSAIGNPQGVNWPGIG